MDRFLSTRFGANHSYIIGYIKGQRIGRLDPNEIGQSRDHLGQVLEFAAQLAKEGRAQGAQNAEARYFRHALLVISSTFKQLRSLEWPEGFDVDMIDFAYQFDGAFLYAYTILALDLWRHPEFEKKYVALQNPNPGRSAESYSYISRDIVNEYTMLLTEVRSDLDYKVIAVRTARLALPYVDLGCLAESWTPGNSDLLKGYENAMIEVLKARAKVMPVGITRSVTQEELRLLEKMLHVKVGPLEVAKPAPPEGDAEFKIESWEQHRKENQSAKWMKCCTLFQPENFNRLKEYGKLRRGLDVVCDDGSGTISLGGEDGVDGGQEGNVNQLAAMFWTRSKNIDDFFQTTLFQLTLFYETLAPKPENGGLSSFSKTICAIRNARKGNDSWILDAHLVRPTKFSALGLAMTDLLLTVVSKAYEEDSTEYHGFDEIVERLVTEAVGEHSMSQSPEFYAFCSSCIARIGSFLMFKDCYAPPSVSLYILSSFLRPLRHVGTVNRENVDWDCVATLGQFDTLAKAYYRSKKEGKPVPGSELFGRIMYQFGKK